MDKEGCWQLGETLGDTQAARTDPFSLSELNSSRARGSNHSVNSLPGPPASCGSTQGSVVSWAESFETLLQDRVAVTYFTVSAAAQTDLSPHSHPWLTTSCHPASVPTRPAALSALQEFLKKEFSAENVYFWQACERFQQIPASDTEQVPASAQPRCGWVWVTQLLGETWAEAEVAVVPACPRVPADPCSGS